MDGAGRSRAWSRDKAAWASLLILPALFVVAALVLRDAGGPFWHWFNLDPTYYYLFDALNLVNLTTPGHFYHPGTPVQVVGAVVLRLAHPLTGADALARAVLADPEKHIQLISNVVVALGASTLLIAGAVVKRALGGAVLAYVIQAAPFLSMLTLKYAYHIRPEPFLLIVTLALVAVTIMALAPGALEKHQRAFPMAFGVIAGLGVAVKFTAAPVFLLPLFVLGRLPAIAAYIAVAVLSLVLFTAPMIPIYGEIAHYFSQVAMASGTHGRGAQTIIDVARYPTDVLGLFKRPILWLTVVLSLAALFTAWWRQRRGRDVPVMETRALAGVCVAIVVHVLFVAKQPTAFYLIPSIILGSLAIVLLYRFVAALRPWPDAVRRHGRWAVAALFAAAIISQGLAVGKQARQYRHLETVARSVGDTRFPRCAKVYFYAASTPGYALYLSDYVAGGRFAKLVAARVANNEFWLNDYFAHIAHEVRDAAGPVDLRAVVKGHACIVFRGLNARGSMARYVARTLPGFEFDADCSTRHEWIRTKGVDCAGRAFVR